MKKVLVLLSTYNGEKFVEQQYKSLVNQENVDVHILVRDDGSKDNTINLLKELGAQDIIEGANVGARDSFFELIEAAPEEYDYYAFCDQDDFWHKDKLFCACEQLNKSLPEKPALYYCGQVITDAELNPVYVHKMDKTRTKYANCIFIQMAGCTAVFNKEMLMQLKKGRPENIFGHDSWTYRLCAALDGDIYVDEEAHIDYRQHGNNVVGLSNSLKSKISRAKVYIYKHNCSNYARELLRLYPNEISEKNKAFFQAVSDANNSASARKKLLHDYDINFNNRMLNLIFKLKVHLKKM